MGCLKAHVALVSPQFKVGIKLICTPNTDVYLRVDSSQVEIPVTGEAVGINLETNASCKVY